MKRKKRPITLLEIMIVVLLIGIIGSVLGYNMKGSLDKGKKFKTVEGANRLKDILMLQIQEGASIDDVVANPREAVVNSGLISNVDKFMCDGWGETFVAKKNGDDLIIKSSHLP